MTRTTLVMPAKETEPRRSWPTDSIKSLKSQSCQTLRKQPTTLTSAIAEVISQFFCSCQEMSKFQPCVHSSLLYLFPIMPLRSWPAGRGDTSSVIMDRFEARTLNSEDVLKKEDRRYNLPPNLRSSCMAQKARPAKVGKCTDFHSAMCHVP